jgi:hypothetical protein
LLSFGRSVFPPIDGTGERDLSADGGRLQQALGAAALTGRLVATPAPSAGLPAASASGQLRPDQR